MRGVGCECAKTQMLKWKHLEQSRQKEGILRHTETAVVDAVKEFLQKGMALRGNTSKDEHCKQRIELMMSLYLLITTPAQEIWGLDKNKTNAVGS